MSFRSFASAITIGVAVLAASSASANDADPGRHAGDLVRLAPDLYGHDLLRNAEVAAETKTILGPAYERFDNTLNVTGKVDLIGGRYVVGTGCRPHSCVETKATLVIDTTTGDVYAALRDEEGSVERPKRSAWPDEVRRVLQDDVVADPPRRDPAPARIASRSGADIMNPVDLDGRVIWDHNGSEVLIDAGRGVIVYNTPKSSIAGTVRIGQVLFRGDITSDGPVSGTAYTFKKGCAPAPYQVSGRWRGGDLVLRGAAPRRSRTGCGVDGYTTSSGNATLKFTFLMSP